LSLLRYTAVGGAATAVHYALLIGLVEALRLPAAPAAALGALAGAAVAYAGNRRFTFVRGGTRHGRAVPRFLLVAGLGTAANALLVWAGTAALREHYLAAQVQATAAGLLLTYALNKRWTFAP
jgi:putative flippase GtrA